MHKEDNNNDNDNDNDNKNERNSVNRKTSITGALDREDKNWDDTESGKSIISSSSIVATGPETQV